MIAVVEIYWAVTSKKLNVMYPPPYTDMLYHFITTQTWNQTGSLVALASRPSWLSNVGYYATLLPHSLRVASCRGVQWLGLRYSPEGKCNNNRRL